MYTLLIYVVVALGPLGYQKKDWVEVDKFYDREYNQTFYSARKQFEAVAASNHLSAKEYKCLATI